MAQKSFGEWDNAGSYLDGGTTSTGKSGGFAASCYHSHTPLVMEDKESGNFYTIYGSSCSHPTVDDADIYIGFAYETTNPSRIFPWEEGYKAVVTVPYPITDMQPPSNAKDFHGLIDWVCNQLRAGKKIHAGCVGGHGRTGTFLVAVVAQMTGMKDAIQYVRKNYCHKAVETQSQISFLMKEFGVSEADATKKFSTSKKGGKSVGLWPSDGAELYPAANGYQGSSGSSKKSGGVAFQHAKRHIEPVHGSTKAIW
jgi:hypothetical protein